MNTEKKAWDKRVAELERLQATVAHLEYAIMVHHDIGVDPDILRQRLHEGLLEIMEFIGEK